MNIVGIHKGDIMSGGDNEHYIHVKQIYYDFTSFMI